MRFPPVRVVYTTEPIAWNRGYFSSSMYDMHFDSSPLPRAERVYKGKDEPLEDVQRRMRPTFQDKKEFIDLHMSGKDVDEVARITGFKRQTVYCNLKDAGAFRYKNRVDHDLIKELARAGVPDIEIAERVGCALSVVRRDRCELGLKKKFYGEDEIRHMHESGMSVEEIADATGVSVKRTRANMVRYGLVKPLRRHGVILDPDAIIADYLSGMGRDELQRKHGGGRANISKILHDASVMRKRGEVYKPKQGV